LVKFRSGAANEAAADVMKGDAAVELMSMGAQAVAAEGETGVPGGGRGPTVPTAAAEGALAAALGAGVDIGNEGRDGGAERR
jgi:hypothetical protein